MNSYFRDDFNPKPDVEFGKPELIKEVPSLVRSRESGDKIYFVKDGIKHWVSSPEVLKTLGFDFGQEVLIDRAVLNQVKSGEPIKMDNVNEFILPIDLPAVPAEDGEVLEIPPHDDPDAIPHEQVPGLTSIIIPAFFNSYQMFHLTGDCIGSIREHTDRTKTPYEIILIENGKGVETFKDREGQTYAEKVIINDENKGYTAAMNQGIRVSQGEYICLMSNDVKVYDGWLEDMKSALQAGLDLVMATPMYGMPFARAIEAEELKHKAPGGEPYSDFQDGSLILTRKGIFDKLGLLDEQFFLYCADVDFLRRMKDAGLKYASTKRVNTNHLISATDIDNKAEIMNQDKAKYKDKWAKDLQS